MTGSNSSLVVADIEGVVTTLGSRLQNGISLVSPCFGVGVRFGACSLLVDGELSENTLSENAEPARDKSREKTD